MTQDNLMLLPWTESYIYYCLSGSRPNCTHQAALPNQQVPTSTGLQKQCHQHLEVLETPTPYDSHRTINQRTQEQARQVLQQSTHLRPTKRHQYSTICLIKFRRASIYNIQHWSSSRSEKRVPIRDCSQQVIIARRMSQEIACITFLPKNRFTRLLRSSSKNDLLY
jgi:hypothetical protein